MSARIDTHVDAPFHSFPRDVGPGICEMIGLPLRVVGADGAPARVLLQRN